MIDSQDTVFEYIDKTLFNIVSNIILLIVIYLTGPKILMKNAFDILNEFLSRSR